MELNWDNAKLWEEKANKEKTEDEPRWNWDCGFKLDFDGSILSVESRFYPTGSNKDGISWDGSLSVLLLGEEILSKDFKEDSLEELKESVEKFVKHYSEYVKSLMLNNESDSFTHIDERLMRDYFIYSEECRMLERAWAKESIKGKGWDTYTANIKASAKVAYYKRDEAIKAILNWLKKYPQKNDSMRDYLEAELGRELMMEL